LQHKTVFDQLHGSYKVPISSTKTINHSRFMAYAAAAAEIAPRKPLPITNISIIIAVTVMAVFAPICGSTATTTSSAGRSVNS